MLFGNIQRSHLDEDGVGSSTSYMEHRIVRAIVVGQIGKGAVQRRHIQVDTIKRYARDIEAGDVRAGEVGILLIGFLRL